MMKNATEIVLLSFCTLVILWVAYKIVKVALRILLGLVVLGLAGYLVWHFLL